MHASVTYPFLMKGVLHSFFHQLALCCIFKGFCADLIKLVAAKCGFDYTIVPNKKSVYGTKISNNTWNGMIGELLEGVCIL